MEKTISLSLQDGNTKNQKKKINYFFGPSKIKSKSLFELTDRSGFEKGRRCIDSLYYFWATNNSRAQTYTLKRLDL